MSDNTPDPNYPNLAGWFEAPLSDEAVHSIHLFLQQFTYQFKNTYYCQISRHVEAQREPTHTGCDSGTPWDDSIDF
jgi:hypothetical protein